MLAFLYWSQQLFSRSMWYTYGWATKQMFVIYEWCMSILSVESSTIWELDFTSHEACRVLRHINNVACISTERPSDSLVISGIWRHALILVDWCSSRLMSHSVKVQVVHIEDEAICSLSNGKHHSKAQTHRVSVNWGDVCFFHIRSCFSRQWLFFIHPANCFTKPCSFRTPYPRASWWYRIPMTLILMPTMTTPFD